MRRVRRPCRQPLSEPRLQPPIERLHRRAVVQHDGEKAAGRMLRTAAGLRKARAEARRLIPVAGGQGRDLAVPHPQVGLDAQAQTGAVRAVAEVEVVEVETVEGLRIETNAARGFGARGQEQSVETLHAIHARRRQAEESGCEPPIAVQVRHPAMHVRETAPGHRRPAHPCAAQHAHHVGPAQRIEQACAEVLAPDFDIVVHQQ